MAELAMSFEGKALKYNNIITGPQGVRGRNSDNTLIQTKLGWSPSIKLADGLKRTYEWIKGQVDTAAATGVDVKAKWGCSKIVQQSTASLDAIDGDLEDYAK